MATILLLETATPICSVALVRNGEQLAMAEAPGSFEHSSKITLLIQEVLEKSSVEMEDLDAVAVSRGPGSYTGLRIGVSTAKGIAYARQIPLIAIDTLQSLAEGARIKYPDCQYGALLDARRMEVYAAFYDKDLNPIRPISADVIETNIYLPWIEKATRTILVGDGTQKCAEILTHAKVTIDTQISASAAYMAILAEQKYQDGRFEDVAYFEPFYLKDFVAGKPSVKGLY